ncbi:uncharacterized protein B0J16DRAFT_412470 [Fusarium flagelliforme]|uniref:uncharacterized protein n=1 Tax=Fusarium flagelliforme TaxID=2675880 RepID=UPI001E8D495C|nr:uncharacterized protein B0J16DRAFT_412470 [Fusarium flagelliforme]KAH7193923.1 hypothetical protein B0J16DRAFT_412470 [Fusarium flagelliforme]
MKFLPIFLALASGRTVISAAVDPRAEDTTCNPYTDWGHVKGSKSYYCYNLGDWQSAPDYQCVSYKTADFCSGKAYCDTSKDCPSSQICRYGICLQPVDGKQCQRTCTY